MIIGIQYSIFSIYWRICDKSTFNTAQWM